jgi:Tfp pilus assembly protein PilF
MESISSARRDRVLTRIVSGMAASLLLALASGCTTTQVVGEDDVRVSAARARRDLGIDYLSTHKTAMAIRELRASLAEDPSDPVVHLWLGEAYRRKGQLEKAREAFETSATLAAA